MDGMCLWSMSIFFFGKLAFFGQNRLLGPDIIQSLVQAGSAPFTSTTVVVHMEFSHAFLSFFYMEQGAIVEMAAWNEPHHGILCIESLVGNI